MGKESGETIHSGGCQCAAVRYEIRGQPLKIYVCHCRECQKQSASAFGISVIVSSSALALVSGSPKIWSRPATIGGALDCAFCPQCGTRLWHGNAEREAIISMKGGSLDRPLDLSQAAHIWISRKLHGIVIPGHVETHTEEPPGA